MKHLAKNIKLAINDFNFVTDVRQSNITFNEFRRLEDIEQERHKIWRNIMATILLKHKVITLDELSEFCD